MVVVVDGRDANSALCLWPIPLGEVGRAVHTATPPSRLEGLGIESPVGVPEAGSPQRLLARPAETEGSDAGSRRHTGLPGETSHTPRRGVTLVRGEVRHSLGRPYRTPSRGLPSHGAQNGHATAALAEAERGRTPPRLCLVAVAEVVRPSGTALGRVIVL